MKKYFYICWPESQAFIELLHDDEEKYNEDIIMVQDTQNCMVEENLYNKK